MRSSPAWSASWYAMAESVPQLASCTEVRPEAVMSSEMSFAPASPLLAGGDPEGTTSLKRSFARSATFP